MRTKRWSRYLVALAAASIVFVATQRSNASPYVWKTRYATTVWSAYLYLSAGYHTFYTSNLSPGTDPVMNLWNGTSVAFNDDEALFDRNSRINNYYVATPGYYSLIVYAYAASSVGTGNVTHEWSGPGSPQVIANSATFGGDSVMMKAPAATYRYETALSPDGVPDTTLFAADCSGRLLAMDDDGGVGLASRLTGYNYCRIIVGAYSFSGYANLYVNDTAVDNDGDGLGTNLEAELGTCDFAPGGSCSAVPGTVKSFDTDRDGLSDSAEVFGVEDPSCGSSPQYLPRWGADPRHKDIFFEADWDTTSKPTYVDGAFANSVQAAYAAGSAADLLNPDGQPGVHVHMDIGTWYPGQTVYGDWGGSHYNPGPTYTCPRTGLFRLAVASSADAGSGVPSNNFKFRNLTEFLHEGGHANGMEHWGTHAEPAVECKPNYRSLMNYGCGAWGCDAYSTGRNAPLNPSNISEADSWPSTQPAPSFLANDPYRFTVAGTTIDWNRDGVIESSGTRLRAGPTHVQINSQCYTARLKHQRITSASSTFMGTSPKLAKRADQLYLFYGRPAPDSQRIYFQHAGVTGADANGSCTGSSSVASSTPCATWSAEQYVALGEDITGFSAYEWGGGLILAYRTATGQLKSVFATAFTGSGDPVGWSSPRLHGSTTIEPELAIMYTTAGTRLGMFYGSSTGTYRWLSFAPSVLDGTSPWTDMGEIVDQTGAAISGTLSPSITAWPSRTLPTAVTRRACGVFGPDTALGFYCYDQASNSWAHYPDMFRSPLLPGGVATSKNKPSLAFHVTRDSTGAPFGADGRGQFWLTTTALSWGSATNPHYFVSGYIDATNPPSAATRFSTYGYPDTPELSLQDGTAPTIFEDGSMSALKGAWAIHYDADVEFSIWALPLVDGTVNDTLRDVSDFRVMERGICWGLHASTVDADCGNASTSPWGY